MNFEKPKNSEFCKNENEKKKKKKNWRYHNFTHVYRKPQSGTVPGIRSDNFFLSFRAIFSPLVLLLFFSLPLLPNTSENQNFEKKKKASGYIIILNLRNKKHNQMMYAYSDMECDRQFFVILGYFLLFYPTIDPENKNLEKYKKYLEILSFYICAP